MVSSMVVRGAVLVGLSLLLAVKFQAPLPEIPENLPIDAKQLFTSKKYGYVPNVNVRNKLSMEMFYEAIQTKGNEEGLILDFHHVRELLDGRVIDPDNIYGTIWVGPYPFESKEVDYTYKRFRADTELAAGRGTADVSYLLPSITNSEDWQAPFVQQVVIRCELYVEQPGKDLALGMYDFFAVFEKREDQFYKLPSLVEGPTVNLLTSDDPTTAVIAFLTDEPIAAAVQLSNKQSFRDPKPVQRHEIRLTGLEADTEYTYQVKVGKFTTREYHFRTAPKLGKAKFVFAFGGDSREGTGGVERAFMGTNYTVLERLTNLAYQQDARLFIQGGDLINGYTTSKPDFETQFSAWKQAVAGFHAERPIYTAMGNHEILGYNIRIGGQVLKYNIVDKWPYETDSSEAVFAKTFVNPNNAPPADPRLPTYEESVYSFHYGPVKFICINNNYWHSPGVPRWGTEVPSDAGGCPEGYILPDQMDWILQEIQSGNENPEVDYLILYMQEPMFPNGGHEFDAMWYWGNNNVRAGKYTDGKVVMEEKGILEVRNQLLQAIHSSPKVAAVLGSDEHGYSKVMIDRDVPVGDLSEDDKDGDNIIDGKLGMKASPMEELQYPVWYFVGGGFGAPYYNRQPTPWNQYWLDQQDDGTYFKYSSRSNILLFSVEERTMSVKVYSPYGELIDQVDDLMAVQKQRTR